LLIQCSAGVGIASELEIQEHEMKTYFGTGDVARLVGKSTKSINVALAAGIIEPDAVVEHGAARKDALFSIDTVENLRRIGSPATSEVVCQ
jgi:hypothetical protein